MSVPFRPLKDWIVVREDPKQLKRPSGLFLPATAADRELHSGEVVAVGPGRMTEAGTVLPPAVRVGEKVLFGYCCDPVELGGVEYRFLKQTEILGVLEEA